MGADHHRLLPDGLWPARATPAWAGARGLILVALGAALAAAPAGAQTMPDYQFEAVDPYPPRQVGVVLKVRVRDAAGRAVHGATVVDAGIDKSPDGQPGAYAPVTVQPSGEYGVYAFKTDLNTDGRYLLSLRLRPLGAAQPVTGGVIFTTPAPRPAVEPAPARARPPVRRP